MAEARDEATDRMVAEAEAMGADAVVSVRYVTAEVAQGAAEILAYGTAVTLVGGTDPDADAEPASESNADVA